MRPILYYRVILRAEAPLAIGGTESQSFATAADGAPDDSRNVITVRRDSHGRPMIPATTLAGSIRAALPEHARRPLMGWVSDAADSEASAPSSLFVLGATTAANNAGAAASVETETRVAIDRTRASAATGQLFDVEALPVGTTVTVYLSVQTELDAELLSTLEGTLSRWHPRLGCGVSLGNGTTRVLDVTAVELDLDQRDHLLAYLNGGGTRFIDDLLDQPQPGPMSPPPRVWGLPLHAPEEATRVLVDETFEIVDSLRIGSGASDGNLLKLRRGQDGTPIVPGSSWKGLLRSRCEYILRSIGVDCCLTQSCGVCPTCQVFGYSLDDPNDAGQTGHRSVVAFADSPIENAESDERAHVAIDRITGGVRDSALFVEEVVVQGTIRLRILPLSSYPTWTAGLLLAALADIDDGYVGVGGGTTRGQGTLLAHGPKGTTGSHPPDAPSDSGVSPTRAVDSQRIGDRFADDIREALRNLCDGLHLSPNQTETVAAEEVR